MKFDRDARRRTFNWVVSGLCFLCVVVALVPLLSILYTAFLNGSHILSLSFLLSKENGSGICVPGNCSAGGIGPAIYATIVVVGLAALISIPVGVLSGIYLSEYGRNRLGRVISFFTDVMTGTPSIVVGLFAFAVFLYVNRPHAFSALDGAVALAIIMVPTVTRTTEEGLRLVPNALREGAYALGIPRYRAVLQIVLSTGRSIIITGAILAVMRAAGEVAPLLVTTLFSPSGYTGLGEPAGLLGPLIFFYATGASTLLVSAAWGASLLLILAMLGISLAARIALRNRFK